MSVQWTAFTKVKTMLVINPDECINCDVCVPACPVTAITEGHRSRAEQWLALNAKFAKIWPRISSAKEPPADAKNWERKPDKLQYFSPNPGAGD
jgi:ferredoxin